jgi:hypothetical protein
MPWRCHPLQRPWTWVPKLSLTRLKSNEPLNINKLRLDSMDFFIRYPDDILSTKIIGERQFNKAVDLFMSATKELTGKVDYRHVYQNFSEIEVELSGKTKVRTCPAALGPGFAAGTTDGPGMFGFQQGDTEVRTLFSFKKKCLLAI